MIFPLPRRLDHLLDDMAGRRLVWVSHSEVDYVFTLLTSLELETLYLGKHIRRKPFDAIKSVT